jgi:hypothetical protein
MPTKIVKALVPTAANAALLANEFAFASLDEDGTLFTVIIHGVDYPDALARIRDWTKRTHVGPVLVTDGESAEDLLERDGPREALRWNETSPSSHEAAA